jgi:hypothetical protein
LMINADLPFSIPNTPKKARACAPIGGDGKRGSRTITLVDRAALPFGTGTDRFAVTAG